MPPGDTLTPDEQRGAITSAFLYSDDKTLKFMGNMIGSDVNDDEANLAYTELGLTPVDATKPERKARLMNLLGHTAVPHNEKMQVCAVVLKYVSDVKVRNIYRKIFK